MKALGYYQQTPAARRRRLEVGLVTDLSLLSHKATFRLFTRGWSLDCAALADELRCLADRLDQVGHVAHVAQMGHLQEAPGTPASLDHLGDAA